MALVAAAVQARLPHPTASPAELPPKEQPAAIPRRPTTTPSCAASANWATCTRRAS